MKGGRSGLLLALVAAAALLAVPNSAIGKPGFVVFSPPERTSELTLNGTHGFHITITRSADRVDLVASGRTSSASYRVHTRNVAQERIAARFPGVGRISVRFHPMGKSEHSPPACKGRGSIQQAGVFRGAIKFRGERGFTQINATHARGHVLRQFKDVCRRSAVGQGEPVPGYSLAAAAKSSGRLVSFGAFRSTKPSSLIYGEAIYTATTWEKRHSMAIARLAIARAPASTFVIEGPGARPDLASVAPPPPFSATASFHSSRGAPTQWAGDLSVELPGAGNVPLTGRGFKSELCLKKHCAGDVGRHKAYRSRFLLESRPVGTASAERR